MPTLAIVGSGIAGMGCAHFLHRDFDVTVFEQNPHTGGHAHTVTVAEPETGAPRIPLAAASAVPSRP